jgi:hypothetical protein
VYTNAVERLCAIQQRIQILRVADHSVRHLATCELIGASGVPPRPRACAVLVAAPPRRAPAAARPEIIKSAFLFIVPVPSMAWLKTPLMTFWLYILKRLTLIN